MTSTREQTESEGDDEIEIKDLMETLPDESTDQWRIQGVSLGTKPPFSAQYLPNLQPQLNSPQTGTMELHRETISRLLRDQLNQNWGGPSIEHAQYLAGFSNKRTQQPADRAFVRLH